jgi:hypothetical protein
MNEPRILPLNGGRRPNEKPLQKYAIVFQDRKTVFHLEAHDYVTRTIESEDEITPLSYDFRVNGRTVLEFQATEVLHVVDTQAVDLPALMQAIKPRPKRKPKE